MFMFHRKLYLNVYFTVRAAHYRQSLQKRSRWVLASISVPKTRRFIAGVAANVDYFLHIYFAAQIAECNLNVRT